MEPIEEAAMVSVRFMNILMDNGEDDPGWYSLMCKLETDLMFGTPEEKRVLGEAE